ncbi:MAG TPA: hypothetical protein VJK09_02625 [Candidatus Paceibacterota bacterium]
MEEKPLIISGKAYISSKRAAIVFGYTNDYIGQLSRAGKIEATMVGRDRYIDYSSISKYVNEKASANDEILRSPRKEESKNQELADNFTNTDEPGKNNRLFGLIKKTLPVMVILAIILLTSSKLAQGVFNSSILSQSRHDEMSAIGYLGKSSILESVLGFGEKVDNAYLGFLDRAEGKFLSFWNYTRNLVLAFLDPILKSKTVETKMLAEKKNESNTTAFPATISDSITDERIRAISREVLNDELAKNIDYVGSPSVNNFGLVVQPGTGNSVNDSQLKQSIKNSFSDDVIVDLDVSGTAGVIKPIFRNATDDSYVFVIVPVNSQ